MASLIENTLFGFRYKKWTLGETFAYFLKGITRELKIAPDFFHNVYDKIDGNNFKKKWLKQNQGETYFDFGICKLPDVTMSPEKFQFLMSTFDDVLLIPCFYADNYDKKIVNYFSKYLDEGTYGYVDGAFDVTVKKDDIVIDAGAWIGDFSAYIASKGAIVYAFEPVEETFQLLCKTSELNKNSTGRIFPVKKGLGSSEAEAYISIDENLSAGDSVVVDYGHKREKIEITTIDKFVEENGLKKIDFIKADIEGSERDMLRGATHVLKTFAPKLAICTYHLPDDPEVLEQIIKEANPNYTIVHLGKYKIFAAVINENKPFKN